MASKKQSGGGGYGGGGMPTGGGGRVKSNVTKISNKKTMSKTEAAVRVKTDRMKKSPAAKDIRAIKSAVKLNNKAKALIVTGGATANAVRIHKNKKKSVPVPRDRKKQ
jgi:hypothetical protein